MKNPSPNVSWTTVELTSIGNSDELRLQSQRADGTLRDPVTMWVVRVGDDLYVRSVKGRSGPWFKGTQDQKLGHITVGGVEKAVPFLDADKPIWPDVDAAYQTKYSGYSPAIVDTVLTAQARESTLRLIPR